MAGCDSFQDDVLPRGEDELTLSGVVRVRPNEAIEVDLKTALNTSSAVRFGIGILPQRGDAEISEDALLTYLPSINFTSGLDYVGIDLYDTVGNLIDSDSLFFEMDSIAPVDTLPNCAIIAHDDYFSIPNDTPFYFSPVWNNDEVCDSAGFAITVVGGPYHGQLDEVIDFFPTYAFYYTPNAGFVGVDSMYYELTWTDSSGTQSSGAMVILELTEDSEETDSCLVAAINDFYMLDILPDSIGTSATPILLTPDQNDILCEEDLDHTITILSGPDQGEAMVNTDNRTINYWNDNVPADSVSTSIEYQLCDEGICDTATIILLLNGN